MRRGALAGSVAVLLLLVSLPPALGTESTPLPARAPSVAYENISATSSLSFVLSPSAFRVSPGESLHLKVTQEADFLHTFTLFSEVNYTFPSGDTSAQLDAFLHTHVPLVNLSLGTTVGKSFYENTTAPSGVGTYEFVCIYHYPEMHGVLTVAAPGSGSGTGGAGAGGAPVSFDEVLLVAIVGLVVVASVLVALRRRRGREPPPLPTRGRQRVRRPPPRAFVRSDD